MTWYLILLTAGVFLIGIEIFVPGGVLGAVGGLMLVGAVITGFAIFPPPWGMVSLLTILLLTATAVFIWMKYFPASPVGRALSLSKNLKGSAAPEISPWKPGMKGIALSTLRPAGKGEFNGQRVDVMADGTWIEENSPIEITRVSGHHIHVREVEG